MRLSEAVSVVLFGCILAGFYLLATIPANTDWDATLTGVLGEVNKYGVANLTLDNGETVRLAFPKGYFAKAARLEGARVEVYCRATNVNLVGGLNELEAS